jgi:hypothetical protein
MRCLSATFDVKSVRLYCLSTLTQRREGYVSCSQFAVTDQRSCETDSCIVLCLDKRESKADNPVTT